MKLPVLFLSVFLLSTASACADDHEGSISFSETEKEAHKQSIGKVVEAATACMSADLDRQKDFYRRYGVAAFYGDRSEFFKLSYNDKYYVVQDALYRQRRDPRLAAQVLKQMRPTSCVGMALKCLERGFRAAGQEEYWSRINRYTGQNSSDGTALQGALRALGWRVLYWNPAPANNEKWDTYEHYKDPTNKDRFWGYHAYRWSTVRSSKKYYYNDVDDAQTLVNFGENVPAEFKRVPFFIGTAHTGYHVFPGTYGNVIEAHSRRRITDPNTVESAKFNPYADGGAPRGMYYSGLIAVPPGY
ncbi:MAG TPA: hypothetical protein VIH99_09680 [Bdellovibrionota bacterium]|jgi:hypothetical protein